jgi:hypothetical protein
MKTLSKPTLSNQSKSAAALAFAEAGAEPKKTKVSESRVFFAPEGHRRLTINVTHEMHKKLRLMAVEQDTTITDILTKLVAKELG